MIILGSFDKTKIRWAGLLFHSIFAPFCTHLGRHAGLPLPYAYDLTAAVRSINIMSRRGEIYL